MPERRDSLLRWALLGLRISLALTFLSAVASRLGFWGPAGSNWTEFLARTAQLNWFCPAGWIPSVAVLATVLESTFAFLLLFGYRVREAALGSALLLILFALAMAVGDHPKAPFDASVFTAAFGALTLHAATPRTQSER